jgi:hypothetical protein
MPWDTGTATSHLDLLEKVHDFITDGSAQQPAGTQGPGMGAEAWTVNKNTTVGFTVDGELHVQGPGLAAADEVLVGIKTRSVSATRKDWQIQGYTAFDNMLAFDDQLNAIPITGAYGKAFFQTLSSGSPITYYIIASGRRFIIITFLANGITQFLFAGLFRAYGPATPDRYPYPLLIAGSQSLLSEELSDVSDEHSVGIMPKISATSGGTISNGFVWSEQFGQWYRSATRSSSIGSGLSVFWCVPPGGIAGGGASSIRPLGLTEGGDHVLHPMEIMANVNNLEKELGYVDGVYWASGLNAADGTIVTIDGFDYLGFKNIFRTFWDDFMFLRLV